MEMTFYLWAKKKEIKKSVKRALITAYCGSIAIIKFFGAVIWITEEIKETTPQFISAS